MEEVWERIATPKNVWELGTPFPRVSAPLHPWSLGILSNLVNNPIVLTQNESKKEEV